jgi:hypothetical protein
MATEGTGTASVLAFFLVVYYYCISIYNQKTKKKETVHNLNQEKREMP